MNPDTLGQTVPTVVAPDGLNILFGFLLGGFVLPVIHWLKKLPFLGIFEESYLNGAASIGLTFLLVWSVGLAPDWTWVQVVEFGLTAVGSAYIIKGTPGAKQVVERMTIGINGSSENKPKE